MALRRQFNAMLRSHRNGHGSPLQGGAPVGKMIKDKLGVADTAEIKALEERIHHLEDRLDKPRQLVSLKALAKPYNKDDNPILADHFALATEVEGLTIMVASGAEADHKSKGWLNDAQTKSRDDIGVDKLQAFSDTIDRQWMEEWNSLYTDFETSVQSTFSSITRDTHGKFNNLNTVFGTKDKPNTENRDKLKGLLKNLYSKSAAKLKEIFSENTGSYNTEPTIKTEEDWLQSLLTDSPGKLFTEKTPQARWNKVKQHGGLITQPTGSWVFGTNQDNPYTEIDTMKKQYVKAMKDNNAALMVIVEKIRGMGDQQYEILDITKDFAVLYDPTKCTVTKKEDTQFTVSPPVTTGTNRFTAFNVECYHGSSDNDQIPTNQSEIHKILAKSDVRVVIGDANITESKPKPATGAKSQTMLEFKNGLSGLDSASVVSGDLGYQDKITKTRLDTLLLNNQYESKNGSITEVDGMMILVKSASIRPA